MAPYDCAALREAIPILRDRVYLNTGTEGVLAEPVLAAYQAAIARQEREGHVALEWRYAELESARAAVARLLNAHTDTIAFTRNATDGHNLVLEGFGWLPGDELLISDQEHPALTHPAAYLADRSGPVVRVFTVDPDPRVTLRNVRERLSASTRFIAFSHVSCESGIRLPAKEICRLAYDLGAWSLVDGAQSLGAIPVDVADLGCDFFVSNGHKWLCGPKETGIFYVHPDQRETLDVSAVGAGTFDRFTWRGEKFDYDLKPSARRFEFGTRNQAAYTGLRSAIAWLEELGIENVYAHVRGLVRQAREILEQTPGVTVLTPRAAAKSAGLITFNLDGREPADVARALWRQGVITRHTTTPPGIRASAAYFNTARDFERLAAALRSLD